MSSKNIVSEIKEPTLILGAGGGYDIYSCIPWYLKLSDKEKKLCILANYTFTDDIYRYDPKDEYFAEITPNTPLTPKNQDYFPEYQLAKFLKTPIYAVRLFPIPTLSQALNAFVIKHKIRHIILVDGGVDVCLFGNETMFGSPVEDSQTFLSCYQVCTSHKLQFTIICNALGVDAVSTDQFKSNWLSLDPLGSSVFTMNPQNYDFKGYEQLIIDSKSESIIQCSILAAMQGHRGLYVNPRLKHKIEPDSMMPILSDETLMLWKTDGFEYFNKSIFYQSLQRQFSMQPKSVWDVKQPERNWLLWNEMIDQALISGRVGFLGHHNAQIVVDFIYGATQDSILQTPQPQTISIVFGNLANAANDEKHEQYRFANREAGLHREISKIQPSVFAASELRICMNSNKTSQLQPAQIADRLAKGTGLTLADCRPQNLDPMAFWRCTLFDSQVLEIVTSGCEWAIPPVYGSSKLEERGVMLMFTQFRLLSSTYSGNQKEDQFWVINSHMPMTIVEKLKTIDWLNANAEKVCQTRWSDTHPIILYGGDQNTFFDRDGQVMMDRFAKGWKHLTHEVKETFRPFPHDPYQGPHRLLDHIFVNKAAEHKIKIHNATAYDTGQSDHFFPAITISFP